MRTWERLRKMKDWLDAELCEGREYKCPVPTQAPSYAPSITDFTRTRPSVFLAWQPMRPNEPGRVDSSDPYSVCPAITIMPVSGHARYVQEKRFDRYQKVHRPQEMGQSLNVQILFSIYEPGERLPGFADSMETPKPDMYLLKDGTEPGLCTLVNWMDDAMELLLRERRVPGTDLVLEDDTMTYSLFTDQAYVVDRRPLYYGFVNAEFMGYASPGNDHGFRTRVDRLLDDE